MVCTSDFDPKMPPHGDLFPSEHNSRYFNKKARPAPPRGSGFCVAGYWISGAARKFSCTGELTAPALPTNLSFLQSVLF
jgi:hypothetical protein